MYSELNTSQHRNVKTPNISTFLCYKVGFPIRTSTDQSLFAAPRSLSQRSTSFIACVRLGIHQMPFWHLITLIINVINNKISVLFKSYDHLGDVIITLLTSVIDNSFHISSRIQIAFMQLHINLSLLTNILVEPDGIEPTTS